MEELRKKWRSLSIDAPASGGAPGGNRRLPLSEKQRVMARFRMLAIVGIAAMVFFMEVNNIFDIPAGVTIAYELFMALAIFINIFQLIQLRQADFAEMTTIEAISFIKRFSRRRSRFKILLIAIAIPLLCVFLWFIYLNHDSNFSEGIIAGGVSGGIIGGIIGFLIDRRFRKDLSAMSEIFDGDDPDTHI